MTDDPACSVLAAFIVGDADTLVVTEVIAAEADFEAMVLALALVTMEPGAVRMPVGTDVGSTFVGATMMPPAAVEAVAGVESSLESELELELELELDTSAYSPVLRTV
jgi:hypothetical protein